MVENQHNILFKKGRPISSKNISKCIHEFGRSYNATVRKIILNTNELDEVIFKANAVRLLNNFGMARSGPYKGIKLLKSGKIVDPKNNIAASWNAINAELKLAKNILQISKCQPRTRTLVLLNSDTRIKVVSILWGAFKKLLPITMGKTSFGLVGASKILFSVFPEIVLPVDNAEWLHVFKTVDFADVTYRMADEIMAWEKSTGKQLENCDRGNPQLTLPGVFNVMAMKARPLQSKME
ncbi:hypothetical protein ACFL6N_04440 [Thermodesulfobacteriota bacterium]